MNAAVRSARATVAGNWRPFLLIQAGAAFLVVAYYCLPGAAAGTQWLADAKVRGGLPFAAVTTACAGAVLPEAARRVTSRDPRPFEVKDSRFSFSFSPSWG